MLAWREWCAVGSVVEWMWLCSRTSQASKVGRGRSWDDGACSSGSALKNFVRNLEHLTTTMAPKGRSRRQGVERMSTATRWALQCLTHELALPPGCSPLPTTAQEVLPPHPKQ